MTEKKPISVLCSCTRDNNCGFLPNLYHSGSKARYLFSVFINFQLCTTSISLIEAKKFQTETSLSFSTHFPSTPFKWAKCKGGASYELYS